MISTMRMGAGIAVLLFLTIGYCTSGSDKEVRKKVTPVVAKRVEKPSGLSTYGCGENVHIVAPVGRWSREVHQRIGCDFFFDRDPLLNGSSADRRRNLHSLIIARKNGDRGQELEEGQLPDGRYVNAYFRGTGRSLAFQSKESFPVYIVVRYLPK